jgi:hypothetical protein
MKASDSEAGFDSKSDLDKGKNIVDTKPSATIATTKV